MQKKWIMVGLFLGILTLGACRTAPIKNYENVPISRIDGAALSLHDVERAIAIGASRRGWKTRKEGTGHIVATLDLRGHEAVVDINYTDQAYSITYKSSQNLKYDGNGHIHSHYNSWINYLKQSINAAFQEIRIGS